MKRLLFLLLFVTSCAFAQTVDSDLKTLTATGTDTYAITEAFPATYNPKERFLVRFTNANTGPVTLNRATLGAKPIQKAGAVALSAGDIVAGGTYLLSYNGTYYQIVGDGGGGGGGSGTVTSVAALTLGTTGTDLISSVANPTTTPVITLNVPTASAANRGALSSTDWTTFNSKVSGTRALTINGTSGNITSSAGAQDLSADRTWTLNLATAGTAGTYRSVTTDAFGRVTSGTNPITLSGYGITDAWSSVTGATLTGNNTIVQSGFNTTFTGTGKVTFSPSATLVGFNFGSFAGTPSVLSDGDTWLNTSTGNINMRISGTTFNSPRILAGVQSLNRIVYHGGNSANSEFTESDNLRFDGTGLLVGGGTITSATRVDIRANGTTTDTGLRIADGGNNEILKLLANGNTTLLQKSGSSLTLGGGAIASELRSLEPSAGGTSYVGFKAPALAANTVYEHPNAYPPVDGYLLSSTAAGVQSWVAPGGSTYYAPSTIAANGTDADFTAVVNSIKHLPTSTLTANRTITIPTGSDGDVIEIHNNEAAFSWLLAGATVYLSDRTTVVTELLYNVPTLMQKINGLWIIKN